MDGREDAAPAADAERAPAKGFCAGDEPGGDVENGEEASSALSRSESYEVDMSETLLLPKDGEERAPAPVETWRLLCMFSFAFTNGTLLSTYLLATLPAEAARIDNERKSVYLGLFIAMAGVTQLSGPLAGLLSDRCTLRLGRRRPFMIAGGVVGWLGLLGQLYASARARWGLYTVSFLLSMLALNVIFSAMMGLVPDLVPAAQTGRANGLMAALGVFGAVCGFAVWSALGGDLSGMYAFYAAELFLSLALSCAFARESALTGGPPGPLTWAVLRGSFWVSPEEHRDFFFVLLSRTLYYMGISSQCFMRYFLADLIAVENADVAVGLVAVCGQVCGSMTAYPTGWLSDRLGNGRKPYIYASCAVMALGNLLFIPCTRLWQVLLLSGVIGAANGGYLTMDYAIAVDTLPSREEAAKFLAVWSVGAFVGTTFGPAIGGPLLYVVGDTGEPGRFARRGYTVLLLGSAAYLLGSAYVLRFVKSAR